MVGAAYNMAPAGGAYSVPPPPQTSGFAGILGGGLVQRLFFPRYWVCGCGCVGVWVWVWWEYMEDHTHEQTQTRI